MTSAVRLSRVGTKMSSMSGLRGIMEDIATSTAVHSERRWLNLGIGNPAAIPELSEAWRKVMGDALTASFHDVSCHYGPSRGLPELVDAIVDYFNDRYGWAIGPRNVVVGPGSQMLCFIAAALFTGPGDPADSRLVLPVTPDYTGYQGLSMTHHGVVGIEPVIVTDGGRSFRYRLDLPAVRRQSDVGLLLLSSPSNPAGRSMPPDELDGLVAATEAHNAPLMVDNAYGDPFPRISEDGFGPIRHDRVINCFSVSKAGLPGERLGFAVADERYIGPIVSFIANSALHAPQLVQVALARALRSRFVDTLVADTIRPFYTQRRKFAESLLADALPGDISWRVHASDGGMFLWVWIDEPWFDDLALYRTLKERSVFIVPGRHFFVPSPHGRLSDHARRCFRVSISPAADVLAEGIGLIGDALRDLRQPRRARVLSTASEVQELST